MTLAGRLFIVPKTLTGEEKDSGNVELTLKRHLVIEFHLIKGIREHFGVIGIDV